MREDKAKIAIVTAFLEFVPGYSLTGIVADQVTLLQRGGHHVDVFVPENYHGRSDPAGSPTVKKLLPKANLKDYATVADMSTESLQVVADTKRMCIEHLVDYDVIMTHDMIFTGWNLPYGQGIKAASSSLPDQKWMHWIHSIPSGSRGFWNLREFGTNHRIIYPNQTDLRRVTDQFRTDIESGRTIPHPKDMRSWMEFCKDTCEFLDDYPAVMSADIVQIYPASSDRLEAKRVKEVILTFAHLKKIGYSVSLTIANQWATGRQRREDLERYTQLYKRNGLTSDEVCFTSYWKEGKYKNGIHKRMLRELFQCSNLFLFPTREETFGLVLPEAVLAGGVLPVLNKSLKMMAEVSGMNADFIDFGSFDQPITLPEHFHRAAAEAIVGRLLRNESIMAKTYMRQRYNWDNLYTKFYMPIISESVNW